MEFPDGARQQGRLGNVLECILEEVMVKLHTVTG